MDDKEKLIALRKEVGAIYTQFGFLFTKAGSDMRRDTVKRVAQRFHDADNLFADVEHRIGVHSVSVATPALTIEGKSFVQCGVLIASHCELLGDLIVEQIENSKENLDLSLEVDYYRMLLEAAETEISRAMVLLDNPKAKLKEMTIEDIIPSFCVTRSDLVNRGRKKGLLGFSTGRLTQLQSREDDPFPKPIQVKGKTEIYLIHIVEAWEKRENERKKR